MTSESPPGLQAERTELAWERTAIGALATAALLALRVPAASRPVVLLAPAAALLLALALTAIGRGRRRRLTSCERPTAAPVAVLVAGLSTVALGALITILAFV